MAVVHRIAPCLWFGNQAEEAARYYVSIFKNSKINIAELERAAAA
jgi:predicted 3-demethylubiquinone-9 3-methyltransferase (glyoxalase superfamily)